MKAFGFAALLIALAAPAGAQQTQQSTQPRQDTAAGASQDPGQSGRTTPNDPTSNDRTSTSPTSQQNRASQGDQGAAATPGQNDRGLGGAADRNRSELPATASALPALGAFGLIAFAGGVLVRRLRTREL